MNVPVERIIELSELRIGNYLEFDGQIVHVTSLSLDIDDEYNDTIGFCKLGSFNNEQSNWNRALADKLKRIQISPEWLLNLGFEKKNDPNFGHAEYYEIPGFTLYKFNENQIEPYDYDTLYPVIKYVHQLQNFYYWHTMTGEELTIKK